VQLARALPHERGERENRRAARGYRGFRPPDRRGERFAQRRLGPSWPRR
jgi:hypothetical protein